MRRARAHGFTLIEIMIVVAIAALMMGGVIVAARQVARTDLRVSSSKLASAIRFLFDRARATGKHYRLVFDLDNGRYWAEQSDDRFYLVREKERPSKANRGPADDDAEGQGGRLGPGGARPAARPSPPGATAPGAAAPGAGGALPGLGISPDDPGAEDLFDQNGNLKLGQPKAVFKSFGEANLKPVDLRKGIRIADVYTPKQREAYSEGRAYLYFFPQGFGERAIIHLTDGPQSFYSLVVHPLTGRVVVRSGYVEIPRDFDRRDDEGNVTTER